jgi:isopenicillin-N epimerase
MLGSMASLLIQAGASAGLWTGFERDELQVALLDRYGIEVPVIVRSTEPVRIVRISAQLYNEPDDYERLADALEDLILRGDG